MIRGMRGARRATAAARACRVLFGCLSIAVTLAASAAATHAQTDYYNLDAGRPVRMEDAYATERYAFELKLAPVRLERSHGGVYHWAIEPELAYGVLPRTHVEIGLPLAFIDAGGEGAAGVAGLELSVLHNLNTETQSLPAFGLRVDGLLPVGRFGGEHARASLTALATRTWRVARLHVNAQYTAGPRPARHIAEQGEAGVVETSRWLAGLAIDRTFPLDAMLVVAEVTAREPIDSAGDVEWATGAGVRLQWSPRLAFDAGLGRTLNGAPAWSFTVGAAWAFGVRALMPGDAR